MPEILLVPIGSIDPTVLQWLTMALRDTMRMSCEVSEVRIDPADAFNAARRQYHSTEILSRVAALPEAASAQILGVASVDLYIPILTFVFGEAQWKKTAAVISTYRLRQEFYGLGPDEKLFYERVEKEDVHELGHNFGLVHCNRFDCVM